MYDNISDIDPEHMQFFAASKADLLQKIHHLQTQNKELKEQLYQNRYQLRQAKDKISNAQLDQEDNRFQR